MELFVLGLVFGAATAQGKAVTKAVAKSYMAVSEKTKEVVSNLKEDMRGAIEEAKVERDSEESAGDVSTHNAEALALREESIPPQKPALHAVPTAASMAAAAHASAAKAKPAVIRGLAKSYMAVTEKTRDAVSGFRENMRDAIEEARYERELAAQRAAESASHTTVETAVEPAPPTAATPKARTVKSATAKPKTRAATGATRTKSAAKPVAQVAETAAPAKRPGRKPRSAAAQELLEVAEIAADAL